MKKILILDDDPDTVDLLQRILSKNYEVFVIDDPLKLGELTKNRMPDLIVIDHFLNHDNTKEFIEDFSHLNGIHNVPVILYSAYELIDKIATSISAAGFIRKPAGISEIRATINRALQSSGE